MMSTKELMFGPLPISIAATMAIISEVTAPKPGNVHRGADFEDVTYVDFLYSAVVIGPIVARTAELGVGETVLEAVRATRAAVGTNTNLGTLLLIAPLAKVRGNTLHRNAIGQVLQELTFDDTRKVFEAIRVSSAGGLGKTNQADVADEPPPGLALVDAMLMAADRDLVARQYCNDFADVFRLAGWIEEGAARGWSNDTAVVHAYMRQLATEADSLIVRKCGDRIGEQARAMACCVVEAGQPESDEYERGLADLDFWLRADGHRRNPGTTADLIAAALFVLLREGRLKLKR
jgi:triphosphoribosyl-dephospho-CoA synthase